MSHVEDAVSFRKRSIRRPNDDHQITHDDVSSLHYQSSSSSSSVSNYYTSKKKRNSRNKKKGREKKRNNNVRESKTSNKLKSFWELPEYMKDNEFILNYYRADWPILDALFSVFRWHNETLNVWTHLIGFVIFVVLTMANLWEVPQVSDLLGLLNNRLRHCGDISRLMEAMLVHGGEGEIALGPATLGLLRFWVIRVLTSALHHMPNHKFLDYR